MPTPQRSADSVYDEIAGLTGNRAELERQRYEFVKAIRAMKALLDDSAVAPIMTSAEIEAFAVTIGNLERMKGCLWSEIEDTDRAIQRLTDLVQNGAYNHESR